MFRTQQARGLGTQLPPLEHLTRLAEVLGRSRPPRGARTASVDIPLSRSGEVGTTQGCQASLGTVHLPVSPLATGWACFGSWSGHAFAQCPNWLWLEAVSHGGLKPCSGMTWASLISSLNCCHQKKHISFSHVLFLSSLLLSIIEHLWK